MDPNFSLALPCLLDHLFLSLRSFGHDNDLVWLVSDSVGVLQKAEFEHICKDVATDLLPAKAITEIDAL